MLQCWSCKICNLARGSGSGGSTGGGGGGDSSGSTGVLNVEFVTGDCWFPLLPSKRGRGCPKVGRENG